MQNHKTMMKLSLAENLRSLMIRHLFEKITIKQICDAAGVIRATFYNYFVDKYDCLNYIIFHDLVEENSEAIGNNDFDSCIRRSLEIIAENREFYRVAYNVTGQNSFEDMLRDNIRFLLKDFFGKFRRKGFLAEYDDDLLSMYYSECFGFCIRMFIAGHRGCETPEETRKMISDLMKNSFYDLIQEYHE